MLSLIHQQEDLSRFGRGDQDDDHYRKFHFRKIEKHIIFNSIHVAFYYLSRLNPSKWTHNDIMPSCMLIMLRVHRLWFSESALVKPGLLLTEGLETTTA